MRWQPSREEPMRKLGGADPDNLADDLKQGFSVDLVEAAKRSRRTEAELKKKTRSSGLLWPRSDARAAWAKE